MATRESLLDVTARLYAEHGWLGTTTRRIAEAAGVNEVTLFRQFGSKESLLLEAIMLATGEHRIPTLFLPDTPGTLKVELAAWGNAHHRSIAGKSGIIRTCLAEWEQRPELAPKVCGGGFVAFADLIRYLGVARDRGMIAAHGPVEAAATMLVNAIFMDAMTRDVMPGIHPHSVDESIESFVDVVLRALAAKEIG
jgi:AcrR family transcriptional regulator